MGIRNYLIEGISGTGKTSVGEELQTRGFHVIHGDNELKYRGDPKTGKSVKEPTHKNETDKAEWRQAHLCWDLDKVKSIMADHTHEASFFCGGSRNSHQFINQMDGVFILDVPDINIIFQRMDDRVAIDPTDFGGKPEEKEMVARLHANKEDIPQEGVIINSTQPLDKVVDEILENCDISKKKS